MSSTVWVAEHVVGRYCRTHCKESCSHNIAIAQHVYTFDIQSGLVCIHVQYLHIEECTYII